MGVKVQMRVYDIVVLISTMSALFNEGTIHNLILLMTLVYVVLRAIQIRRANL